jgi:hypothetical protein
LKARTIILSLTILTLLIGFTSGNFLNPVFAEDEISDEEHSDAMKEERKEQRDAMKDEYKEQRDTHNEKMKVQKQEIKSEYKELKIEFKQKYHDMKDELKNQIRDFKQARLTASDTATSSEVSEADILAFEEKRIQVEDLKREFREHIHDLKTQVRQDISTLKQDYIKLDEERRDKINDILSELRLKHKDQIKEHRANFVKDKISDSADGKHVLICHNPPGNTESVHSIRVSINSVYAHLQHEDTLGDCEDAILYDEVNDETNDEEEIEIKVEIEDGLAKILVMIGDEILNFDLEEIDRELIIQYIADNTDLTNEEIETYIEFTDDEGETIHVNLKEELGLAQQ